MMARPKARNIQATGQTAEDIELLVAALCSGDANVGEKQAAGGGEGRTFVDHEWHDGIAVAVFRRPHDFVSHTGRWPTG